jgi:hypothetical protein
MKDLPKRRMSSSLDNPMASAKDMLTLLFMGILRSHCPTHNLAQNDGEGKGTHNLAQNDGEGKGTHTVGSE